MSVAFRRDCDEEHLEPKFERPIPIGPNLVTAHGRTLIDDRIDSFENKLVGLSEEDAKPVHRDLRYWKTRRATAVETAPPADGSIGFGSIVDIRLNGTSRTIHIVGDDEANPKVDHIAFSSPLARALIGAEVGEAMPFHGREDAIEIIAFGS